MLLPGDKSTRQLSGADKSPSMQCKKAFMPLLTCRVDLSPGKAK